MRKKSLRAMTSAVFEAPESRAEAILQNILGANNVIVPPEAPVEEILQAILYNTPYTKEAEARIEEILLAIKNNGTYDEEAQSRDEEILISKLNETAYTKDAESRIEELLILWAAQSVIKQLEGVPPLAFTAQGQPLINWIINGANGGVGDKTENLFDYQSVAIGKYIDANGVEQTSASSGHGILNHSNTINIAPNTPYSFKIRKTIGELAVTNAFCWFDENMVIISRDMADFSAGDNYGEMTFTSPANATYLIINFRDNYYNTGICNSGSSPLPYQPYGYKIPILCGGETNTIYLDTPLYDGDSISMADTGMEIPTINGQNTLAVDTTVQPEKVYIEYK